MCKTCQGGGNNLTNSKEIEIGNQAKVRSHPQARMSFQDDKKKGQGERKGLSWKEAIVQTALM